MIKKAINKFFYSLLILWGVITLVFVLFNVLPGDPARMMLGQRADLESVEMIRKEMGLNDPLAVQYFRYINDLSPLSIYTSIEPGKYKYVPLVKTKSFAVLLKAPFMGVSFQSNQQVGKMIADVLPRTILLATCAIVLAMIVGIFFGILCAVYKDSWFDRLSVLFSTIGVSLPSFFTAILFAWIFAFLLANFTHLNLTGNLYRIDPLGGGKILELKNLILPSVTLGIRPLSIFLQLSRNSMIDVLNQDYIRTAYSKGLKFSQIIVKHGLRNAMNPVVTAVSGWFASLLAGVVFVEYIFGWKGLGYLIVNSLNNYDMPVVLGSVITIACIFVIVNMLTDITYGILDPRIRAKH